MTIYVCNLQMRSSHEYCFTTKINQTNQQNVLKMWTSGDIFSNFKARLKAYEYLHNCMQLMKINGHMKSITSITDIILIYHSITVKVVGIDYYYNTVAS